MTPVTFVALAVIEVGVVLGAAVVGGTVVVVVGAE
jgi:hypothetical protein